MPKITASCGTQVLPRHFKVTGELCKIPRGSHVWLVSRTNGLYPQAELSEGHFSVSRKWDNPNDARRGFSYVLLLVGSPGQTVIGRWLNHGAQTGDWPALFTIPGMRELDTVQDLRLRGV